MYGAYCAAKIFRGHPSKRVLLLDATSITIQHRTQKWSQGANDPYRPRRPEDSAYYQCVEDHFEHFEQVYEERFERTYGFYRPYLRSAIYRYLECGILRNGFARVRCADCGHEYLLAFSCKRRHFCPFCHQKRMGEFGEWVYGEVLKKVASSFCLQHP